jgi:2-hydroxy-6-oxonona-2,4-dienedioate hydrolase
VLLRAVSEGTGDLKQRLPSLDSTSRRRALERAIRPMRPAAILVDINTRMIDNRVRSAAMNEDRYRRTERDLWRSLGAQPAEQCVALERTGMRVRLQEIGEGPTVIFIHGASNGATSWAPLAARLQDFHCVLLDRPGCGLSPRLKARLNNMSRLGSFADALIVDVLDALAVSKAHLVGTSFGGYFALRTAAAHRERVNRIVLLGWSFGAPAARAPFMMRVATRPVLGRVLTKVPVNERMLRAMLKQIGLRQAVETGRFGPTEIAWFQSLLRDTDTMRNEIDASPRIMSMRGFNEETLLTPSLLSSVEAPTYLLWGEDDPMGGAEIAREFSTRLPSAELDVMPHAGHAPWIDDPEFVARRVAAFLS